MHLPAFQLVSGGTSWVLKLCESLFFFLVNHFFNMWLFYLFFFPTGQMSWKHHLLPWGRNLLYFGHRSKFALLGAINTLSLLILKRQQNNFSHTENIKGKSCFEMWRGTKSEATISFFFLFCFFTEKRKIKFSCHRGRFGLPTAGNNNQAECRSASKRSGRRPLKPVCHRPSVTPPTPPAFWTKSLSRCSPRQLVVHLR